jgi:hypothetical protein
LREQLISQIAAMFPNDVSVIRRGGKWRSLLQLSNGLIVSVIVARSIRIWKETLRWRIDSVQHERGLVTLLARLNERNDSFLDFHVIPKVERVKRFDLRLVDGWLNRGHRLSSLHEFCRVVASVDAHGDSRTQADGA